MSTITLDFSSYEKALKELESALQYYHSDLAQKDPKLARHLMAAVIQAFEYTYELSVKFLFQQLLHEFSCCNAH